MIETEMTGGFRRYRSLCDLLRINPTLVRHDLVTPEHTTHRGKPQ